MAVGGRPIRSIPLRPAERNASVAATNLQGGSFDHYHDCAISSQWHMTLLKKFRESSPLSPEQLAAVGELDLASYYDRETYDDELTCNISLDSIARLARALGLKPSAIYGGQSTGVVSLEQLALLLRERFARSGRSLDDFETELGGGVEGALDDPEEFRTFNVDGLVAVCGAVNIVWYDVLDGL